VVTFALGAAAIGGGCGGKDSGNGPPGNGIVSNNPPGPSSDGGGDSSIGDGGCPAEQPTDGTPCDLPSSVMCVYQTCSGSPDEWSVCQGGTWMGGFGSCNPPVPVYEAGPDVLDDGPDGEGQDGGRVADATGDVATDAGSE
jgi:hypothetical protein